MMLINQLWKIEECMFRCSRYVKMTKGAKCNLSGIQNSKGDDDDDDLYIIGAVCLSVRHKSDYFQIFSKISKFSKNFKI